MNSYYIDSLKMKKEDYEDLYNDVVLKKFGRLLSLEEINELERVKQMELVIELENRIELEESNIDVKKLARAIQNSRSGIGGSAMTPYQCKLCDKEEIWVNTAVPNICGECASTMARNIVLYGSDIFKK